MAPGTHASARATTLVPIASCLMSAAPSHVRMEAPVSAALNLKQGQQILSSIQK